MKTTIMHAKRLMIALTMMLATTATGNAMSYEQARNEALFLTDKMAYELNLTDAQYEAAYEINLDYLMGVTSYDDVFGTYWERRNLDMSYILLDWQWNAFCAATYFYRPLYWQDGLWHFAVYARYPYRDYFYFGRPVFYASYRGGHAWHAVGGRGYYYSHRDRFHNGSGRSHFGMLDRWNRGDFRHSQGHYGNGRSHFGGVRNSSTRTTVNHRDREHFGNNNNHNYNRENHSTHGGSTHSGGSFTGGSTHSGSTHSGSSSNSGSTHSEGVRNNGGSSSSNGSFRGSGSFGSVRNNGGSSSSSSSVRGSGSFGGSHSSSSRSSSSFGGSHGSSSRSSGSFGGSHSSPRSSQGSGSVRSSGSFGRHR